MQVEAQLRGRTPSAAAAAVRTDMEIKWWRIGMETRSSGGEWEERATLEEPGHPPPRFKPPSPASATPGPVISTSSFSDSQRDNTNSSGVSTFDALVGFIDTAA